MASGPPAAPGVGEQPSRGLPGPAYHDPHARTLSENAAWRTYQHLPMPIPVAVLGAGSFGTCLALLCAREHDVTIWARDPELARAINRDHRNPRYLTGQRLPDGVRATSDLAEALADRELVICSVPSHGVREVMRRAAPHFPEQA